MRRRVGQRDQRLGLRSLFLRKGGKKSCWLVSVGNHVSAGCLFLWRCRAVANSTVSCTTKSTHAQRELFNVHCAALRDQQAKISGIFNEDAALLDLQAPSATSNIIKVILNLFHELVMAETSQFGGLMRIYALPCHAGVRETRPK